MLLSLSWSQLMHLFLAVEVKFGGCRQLVWSIVATVSIEADTSTDTFRGK
jgi:hypothetical protein